MESRAGQKRHREETYEQNHPAKRLKTAEETEISDKKKDDQKRPTGKSRTIHSLRDMLFEFEAKDIHKFVSQLLRDKPETLDKLKSFMYTHSSLCKLFVRGLLPRHREMDLRNMYSQYGNIRDTRILYDRQTGVSKNIGFIVYDNCEQALRALQRPELTIDMPNGQKRTVYLNLAMKPHNLNNHTRRNANFNAGFRRNNVNHHVAYRSQFCF